MAEESNLVIKVKYENTLRRFGAYVHGQSMEYNMIKLRAKITDLFKLNSVADLILTYTDEDGDVVTLDNEDELHDAVLNQRLNPLRINVQSKTYESNASESQVANWSQQAETGLLGLGSVVDSALKSIPEPLCRALSKLSQGLELNVASSSAGLAEGGENSMLLSNINLSSHGPPDGSHGITGGPLGNLMDLNVGDKPKTTDDPIPATSLYETTNSVDPEHISKQKDMVNMTQSQRKGTSRSVDVNVDLSINDLLSCSLTTNYCKELKKGRGATPGGMTIPASPSDQAVDRPSENFVASNSPSVIPYNTIGVAAVLGDDSIRGYHTSASAASEFHCSRSDVRYKGARTPLTRMPFPKRPHNYHATCHRGVRCDGCQMYPIIGPRFKSNVKEDYDLCSFCFSDMGNVADYTRIDRPQSRRLLKESLNRSSRYGIPPARPFSCGMRSPIYKPESLSVIQSCFIRDITIADGTVMLPSTPFTKIWRMRNNGTLAWPAGTHLLWTGGHLLGPSRSAQLENPTGSCPVNKEIDIAVDLISPSEPGWYTSYWRLASSDGQLFGELVWVQIKVVNHQSSPAAASGINGDIDINQLPVSSGQHNMGIIDVNAEPTSATYAKPNITSAEPESSFNATPSTSVNAKHKFTAADLESLFTPSITMESVISDRLMDANEHPQLPPALIALSSKETSFKGSASSELPERVANMDANRLEQNLLKELEEMSFEQRDLNNDVPRLNENNLESSINELHDSTPWDPLLEELRELGFHDEETNKKLMVKNGGSIKRVVMDLIAEEKR